MTRPLNEQLASAMTTLSQRAETLFDALNDWADQKKLVKELKAQLEREGYRRANTNDSAAPAEQDN